MTCSPTRSAAGDFNADGADDLAVGTERESLPGADDCGAVNAIYGSTSVGLSPTATLPGQFWHQARP